ncbi:MAG: cytochrome P450 [Acidimicrobiales bacterium]
MSEKRGDDGGIDDDRLLMDALFSPEGAQDPHCALRGNPTVGCRYAVVDAALRDTRFGSGQVSATEVLHRMVGRFMARMDGDRHRDVRGRFSRIFTPNKVRAYRAVVERRADDLLNRMSRVGSGDLVAEFARPLPFGVIADVMGVPVERHAWLEQQLDLLGAGVAGQRQRDLLEQGNDATSQLLRFFGQCLDERRDDPTDDLLGVLATDDLVATAREDLLANCVFFLLAGHMTTTVLLAAGAAVLSEHPDQLALLMGGDQPWSKAVEELLRYLSPITITGLRPSSAVTIGDVTFDAGVTRLFSFAAANRDPSVFAHPDEFDITRAPIHHLAFSEGRHFCLGAPLARLHAEVALPMLFERLPGLHLEHPIRWRGAAPVRQIEALPIVWTPAH